MAEAGDNSKLTDAELKVLRFTHFNAISAQKARPVSYQPDMFVDRAPAMERIEAEGQVAGLSGKTGISDYGTGSPEDQAWLKGWTKGQKSLADDFITACEKRNSTFQDNDPGFDDDQQDAAE